MLQNGIVHVVLISVEWDVAWVLAGWWDDSSMPIGALGVGRESSCMWLSDVKNGEEP